MGEEKHSLEEHHTPSRQTSGGEGCRHQCRTVTGGRGALRAASTASRACRCTSVSTSSMCRTCRASRDKHTFSGRAGRESPPNGGRRLAAGGGAATPPLSPPAATRLVYRPSNVRSIGFLHRVLPVAQAQRLQDSDVVFPRASKAALQGDEQGVHRGTHGASKWTCKRL